MIRAGIIRFLLMGGDDRNPVHENGVMVEGAWIKGELALQYTSCVARLLARHCRFDGTISAIQADLPALLLPGSSIPRLSADGIKVSGDIILNKGFSSTDGIRLGGAEIGGNISCSGAQISNKNDHALFADRAKVKGSVFLRDDFNAEGEVHFVGAEIDGDLDCNGGAFLNAGGDALQGDRIKVKGNVFLGKKARAEGEVRLLGSEIGGQLSFAGGTFIAEKEDAISLDKSVVRGSVFLSNGFRSTGEVRLLGAEIGGNIDCNSGTFENGDGDAISADRIKVKGSVTLGNGFSVNGTVRFLGAEIGGNIECSRGKFTSNTQKTLILDGACITDGLFLREGLFSSGIDLTACYASTLVDDQSCCIEATLFLDGFRYDRIIGPTNARVRIEWLNTQYRDHVGADFKPQPWEQLIRVLRDMGHPAEAAQIAIAKQEALRAACQIGLRRPNPKFSGARYFLDSIWSKFSNVLARVVHWLYGWIAGYGHRPARIVWRMILVCVLCSLAYYAGRADGLFGPSSPVIHLNPRLSRCGSGGDRGTISWTAPDCPVPPEYSTFQPFFFSVDVILPFVDLHQEADWGPVVTDKRGGTLWGGRILRWIMWFEIVFGWICSVMFVAIVGRLVDKD